MTAKCALLLASLLACAATPLAAQSLWPRPIDGSVEFGAEWVRPTFDYTDEYAFTRGVWILDARFRAGNRINVTAAFPRMTALTDAGGASTMGAIYVGVEFTDTAGRPEFSLGMRKGGADPDDGTARAMGLFGDFDRFEQAMTTGYAVVGSGHVRPWKSDDGGFAEIRFGGMGLFEPAGEGTGSGAFYFDYGIRIGREGEKFGAGFAWTGRLPFSGNDGPALTNSVDQLTLDAAMLSGPVRPTLAVRVPFDENLKEILDFAVIVGVRVALK